MHTIDHGAALTAAYIVFGMTHNAGATPLQLTEHWGEGQAELFGAPLNHMPYLAAMEAAALREVGDYPGVFDYEVSEAFGGWFALEIMKHPDGDEPADSLTRAHIRSLLVSFFGAGMDAAALEHLANKLNTASQEYLEMQLARGAKGSTLRVLIDSGEVLPMNIAEGVKDGDETLTAEQLDAKYNPNGDGEHPVYTRWDWKQDVASGSTLSGYWDWVQHQLTS